MDAVRKRSYEEISTDPQMGLSKMARVEKRLIAKYIHGADHKAIYCKVFTFEGLLELEKNYPGCLMFKLNVQGDCSKNVIFSLFMLLIEADNVSESTKNYLRSIYSSPDAVSVLANMEKYLHVIHRTVCAIGCVNSVSVGATSLISCVLQGNVYNDLKTVIFPLLAPKEIYINLNSGGSFDDITTVYLVFVYNYSLDIKVSMYLVSTSVQHRETFFNLLRHRFSAARYSFLNRYITNPKSSASCVGAVRKIGWCNTSDINTGVVAYKSVQLPVVRFENFCVEFGQSVSFI